MHSHQIRGSGLGEILAAYLEAASRGEAPPRKQWLAEHPQHEEELRRFLDNEQWLRGALQAGQETTLDAGPSADPAKVRYVGDPVALVVAETRYLAEDACELIEVDYEPQVAVVDYTKAAADTENLVHAGWGLESNAMVQVPFTPLTPDLDEVFSSAANVVECDVEQNRYVAMPMETRGIVASFHKGRQELDIACATQSVHETKNFFARYVQIPEGHVHVTAPISPA